MNADKRIFVIAGPNRAGKTTFATEFLVPEPLIRRRFHAGWRNFEHVYRDLVDAWAAFDNSGGAPKLLAEGSRE